MTAILKMTRLRAMRTWLPTVALTVACGIGAEAGAEARYEPVRGEHVPRQPYTRFTTRDSLDRTVTFYLSEEHGSPAALPLCVYVHGSGAQSHFVTVDGGTRGRNGHNSIADVVRGRARLVIVEKPGVTFGEALSDPGGAVEASPEFRSEHTLDRWAEAVHAAIAASRRLDEVDAGRVLVIGHSEGGIVAAKVAADHAIVTHVAVLAGGGPSQLYSLLTLAREGAFFGTVSESPDERVATLLEQWARVRRNPDDPDAFFLGHPHRRWTSFLRTSTAEQLARTRARIFVAQGTEDRAVAVQSFDILRGELLARGKDATFHLVEGADHSFVIDQEGQRTDLWAATVSDVIAWFLE